MSRQEQGRASVNLQSKELGLQASHEAIRRRDFLARSSRLAAAVILSPHISFGASEVQEKAVPKFTEQQISTLETITGLPFKELDRNFDIEFSVEPDKNGLYILHLGQTHEEPADDV